MKTTKMRNVMLTAAAILLAASPALALKGPQNVSRTVHNLSSTSSLEQWDNPVAWPGTPGGFEQWATNETEVCIFCHTPHGGTTDRPLWNRDPSTDPPTHYTSSTLTAAASNQSRAVNIESIACLSCHDGTVATNQMINPSNVTGQPENLAQGSVAGVPLPTPIWFGLPSNIGESTGNYTNDHPFSFSYTAAWTEEDAGPKGLHTINDAQSKGVRFFNGNVECSSCHDPHVSYNTFLDAGANADYAPFLITTSKASYLCLACHNK